MVDQVFVARERELAQLWQFLDRTLGSHGQICFVTGEVGSGKTALVTEFARRAQERHGDLVVAVGQCDAHTGIGDPYLPFREVLCQLTGDVDAKLDPRSHHQGERQPVAQAGSRVQPGAGRGSARSCRPLCTGSQNRGRAGQGGSEESRLDGQAGGTGQAAEAGRPRPRPEPGIRTVHQGADRPGGEAASAAHPG
ncbi:MAG: AAA family ATPase [Anaerolineae bacterium]|nr:AAA family ATPase [Anaerolineae bacterium]